MHDRVNRTISFAISRCKKACNIGNIAWNIVKCWMQEHDMFKFRSWLQADLKAIRNSTLFIIEYSVITHFLDS